MMPVGQKSYRSANSPSRLEMRKPPYYTYYSKTRLFIHKLVTGKYFDVAISGVIGLNVITMSLEYYQMPQVSVRLERRISLALQRNAFSPFDGHLIVIKVRLVLIVESNLKSNLELDSNPPNLIQTNSSIPLPSLHRHRN